jgi:hypothetical protein
MIRSTSENYDWGLPEDGEDEDISYTMPDLRFGRIASSVAEPILTRNYSFKIFEESEIDTKQKAMVEKVVEILKVSDSIARGLLIKFQWNVETLLKEQNNNENIVY